MNEQIMACMYYPTTVIAVDDNLAVLKNLELKLGRIMLCKTFSIPEEALDYIEKNIKKRDSLEEIVHVNEESSTYISSSEQLPIAYDVSKIYQHVYKEDRFSNVSVIIVDYAMPGMNGEELCRKLRAEHGSLIKIIMLTGEANDPKAIQLFNAGVIDRFIRKSQQGVDEALINTVLEMQEFYFKDLTSQIFKGISSEKTSALGDPAFAYFFDKVRQEISATSYYLIEISGSFIFFDNAGKPTWLIIKTLEELEEIAEQIEPDISEKLVDSIAKGEVVPYFKYSELVDYYSDEEKLEKALHKAEALIGEKMYRYALLDKLPEFSLDKEKIVSFNQYISSL